MTVAEIRNDLLLYVGANVENYLDFLLNPRIKAVWDEIHQEIRRMPAPVEETGPYIEEALHLSPERCEELHVKIFAIKVRSTTVH
jgi:hypothetical protein